MKTLPIILMLCAGLFINTPSFAQNTLIAQPEIRDFINHMATKHGFDAKILENWFSQIKINQTIINQMNHPAEAKPWHQYRKIFLTEQNIKQGEAFWKENEQTLKEAEKQYGVPPEIIVGILGVETRYGKNTGNFLVLEALSTLGFHYPKRAVFFKKELEEFLLLVKEQQFDPLTIKGSYAGAMGKSQFIASSYRHFAVDFHDKGQKDILTNNADAIGSVANYFKLNGWQANQPVLVSAIPYSKKHVALPKDKKNPKPTHTILDWIKQYDVSPSEDLPNLNIEQLSQYKAALIELEGQEGKEYWLGLDNFYVITRYNHSDHYAMAVHQLGQEIKNRVAKSS